MTMKSPEPETRTQRKRVSERELRSAHEYHRRFDLIQSCIVAQSTYWNAIYIILFYVLVPIYGLKMKTAKFSP